MDKGDSGRAFGMIKKTLDLMFPCLHRLKNKTHQWECSVDPNLQAKTILTSLKPKLYKKRG